MPAGRGRKGERQPRSRRGKQTTSMVVPRNPLPSATSIGANGCENYPDGAQLRELYPASCQPSVATRQAQLSPFYPAVYNPPGFPFHGGRFHHSCVRVNISSSHPTSPFPSGTPLSILVYSTIGSNRSMALGIVAAFVLPHGLAEKCEKMLWLRRQFFRKISSATTQHRSQALRPSGSTQGREHRSVGAQRRLCQQLLPSQSCTLIMKKNPVFDGRVHIDLSTYHFLDEGQREMLKALGLIVNIVNSQ